MGSDVAETTLRSAIRNDLRRLEPFELQEVEGAFSVTCVPSPFRVRLQLLSGLSEGVVRVTRTDGRATVAYAFTVSRSRWAVMFFFTFVPSLYGDLVIGSPLLTIAVPVVLATVAIVSRAVKHVRLTRYFEATLHGVAASARLR